MEQVKRSDKEVVAELRQSALELMQWEGELPEGVDVDREHYRELLRDIRAEIVTYTEPGRSLMDVHSILDGMGAEDSPEEKLRNMDGMVDRAISATFDVVAMHMDIEEILDGLVTALTINHQPTPEQMKEKLGEALALIRGLDDDEEGGQ
jgi:hypothetical protein